MSKKKYLVVLPALAILSLVGAGFSTWYFGDETITDSTIDVGVTDYVDVGKMKVEEGADLRLVLDQSPETNDETNGLTRLGIHFEGSLTITYTVPVWTEDHGFTIDGDSDTTTNNIINLENGLTAGGIKFSYALSAVKSSGEAISNDDSNNIYDYIKWTAEPKLDVSVWVPDDSSDTGTDRVYKMVIRGDSESQVSEHDVLDDNFSFAYLAEPKDSTKLKEMADALADTDLKLLITAKYTAPTGSD